MSSPAKGAHRPKLLPIAVIQWRDAQYCEANDPSTPVDGGLALLSEVGFIVGETDDTITLGMELAHNVEPGRWRITVPKALIVEMRILSPAGRRTK
jgi:hypothetical protein